MLVARCWEMIVGLNNWELNNWTEIPAIKRQKVFIFMPLKISKNGIAFLVGKSLIELKYHKNVNFRR